MTRVQRYFGLPGLLIGGTVVAVLWAGPVGAQILLPINPNKQADDINGRILHFDQRHAPVIAEPIRPGKLAPLDRSDAPSRLVPTALIPDKAYDTSVYPTRVVPRVNFAAKRAAASDEVRSSPVVPSGPAPVSTRRIRAFTPSGEEELKKQFNVPER